MNPTIVPAIAAAAVVLSGLVTLVAERGRRRAAAEAARLARRRTATADVAHEALTEYDADGRIRFATLAAERLTGRGAAELTDLPFLAHLHPDDRAAVLAALRDEDRGSAIALSYRVCTPDGTVRDVEARWLLLTDAGGTPVGWLAAELDVTARRRAEADARHDAELFQAVIQIQQAIAAVGLDADAVRNVIIQRCVSLTGADGAAIETVDGDELVTRITSGISPARFRVSGSFGGMALKTGVPQRCDDTATDQRLDCSRYRELGIRSLLAVPLGHEGRLSGVLKVVSQSPGAFSERDERSLSLLAGLMGAVLNHAEVFAARQSRLEQRGEALQESEERFKQLVDAAQEGIWVLDDRGVTTYVNQRMLEQLGHTPGAVLGRPLLDFVDPAGRPAIQRILGAPTTPSARHDIRFRRKDGSELWTIASASPILDRQGQFVGTVALITDITERKRAEERLQRSAERLQTLHDIDQAILGARSPEEVGRAAVMRLRRMVPCQRCSIVVFDFEREEAELIAGLSNGEAIPAGRFPLQQLSPVEVLRRGAIRYIEDIGSVPGRPPMLDALAAEGVRSVLSVPLLVEGEVIGELNLGLPTMKAFESEHRDIAVEVAIPLAVALQHTRLREELARRTAELERRLAQAAAAQRELGGEYDTLVGALAHDLRAPLRHLDGFSELLLDEHSSRLDPAARHYAERIRDGARTAGRLLEELVTLGRVTRQDLLRNPTDLGDLVQELIMEFDSGDAHGAIAWEVGPLPVVDCDQALARIAVRHLLSNAAKFTRRSSRPAVQIRTITDGSRAGLVVQDNGVGFSPSQANALFEPFRRLHSGEEFEGSGMGLAMVQRIARQHGGRVWAEGEPGGGAKFYLTLGPPVRTGAAQLLGREPSR